MINCYKILEVANFSDEKTVQRGYRGMAKKYHPDVNSTAEANEIFVLVAKAYETLGDSVARRIHDEKLKKALMWESEPAFKKQMRWHAERGISAEKRRQWAYAEAKKEISDFERRNHEFPFTYRIIGGFAFAIVGLQIIFKNYFIDLNSNEMPLLILGFCIFVISCVFVLAHVYKKLRIDLLLKRARWSYDRFSFGLFFAMLIIGPSTVFGLNRYRKVYHLEHYPALATAEIVEMSRGNVIFSYKPIESDHIFMKEKTFDARHIYNVKENWIIVRYSLADPRIVELVERAD